MRAEAAGDPGPWRQQAVLGRSQWDAEALVAIVRDYVLENLTNPDAVLVIDETGFLKQGKTSCGVGRQYRARPAKSPTARSGCLRLTRHATATPSSIAGSTCPRPGQRIRPGWRRRMSRQGTVFATKPALARQMIERAIAIDVPFCWVAADTVYGVGDIEMDLRRVGKDYVLGVAAAITSDPGGTSPRSRGRLKISPGGSTLQPGSGCQRAKEPRARGCMTGPIANWPIWTPANTTRPDRTCGPAAS